METYNFVDKRIKFHDFIAIKIISDQSKAKEAGEFRSRLV